MSKDERGVVQQASVMAVKGTGLWCRIILSQFDSTDLLMRFAKRPALFKAAIPHQTNCNLLSQSALQYKRLTLYCLI